jgi:sugar/nucleoside kinase (ribokinase family)
MKAVVVGIANVQTSVPVDGFPVPYTPARYLPGRLDTVIGGVGFTVAAALAGLGDTVRLCAPLGDDVLAAQIEAEASGLGIDLHLSGRWLRRTPRSVVLFDPGGRRMISTDLGDVLTLALPAAPFAAAVEDADVVVLGNLDLCRPLLPIARGRGRLVAVDLQDVHGLDNPYDRDFLTADVLVMSHERLAVAPGRSGVHEAFLLALRRRAPTARLVVLTLGAGGSLALTPELDRPLHTPAVDLAGAEPGNTAGAGDTFLAALLHHLVGEQLSVQRALAAATLAVADLLRRRGSAG